jgi:hypothetical protein
MLLLVHGARCPITLYTLSVLCESLHSGLELLGCVLPTNYNVLSKLSSSESMRRIQISQEPGSRIAIPAARVIFPPTTTLGEF